MNIYIASTESTEFNITTNNLSTAMSSEIANTDELEEANLDIEGKLNEDDLEISDFYKKYRSKNQPFDKTESQKKLNKIKVYLIVKSKIIDGKEVKYAVPIRNYDDLGNSLLEKSTGIITGLFYLRKDHNLHGRKYTEGSPGARPFRLDEVLDPEPPYLAEQDVPLADLVLPKKYLIHGEKLKLGKYFFSGGRLKLEKEPTIGEVLEEPDEFDEAYEDLSYILGFYPTEYEYYNSMVDDTVLTNSSGYGFDIREKNSFNGEHSDTGFLYRLKNLKLKENPFKLFNTSNIFSLIFGDKDILVDKNIIPVFSNLEDAQDLLITILDEVHQPFQVRRKVEEYTITPYSNSLNYLDDSFSFQNDYFISTPTYTSKLEQAQLLLRKYDIIKASNLPKPLDHDFYDENKYQIKGPFFIEDYDPEAPNVYVEMSQKPTSGKRSIWRETDYWAFFRHYLSGQQEAYSWQESRDITDADKGLLKKSQDIKVISMGLGDFLEFWNNPIEKNAEVLFIPSIRDLKIKIPLIHKRSRDKFYDYQQKFRESRKQDTENHIYEIKLSDE